MKNWIARFFATLAFPAAVMAQKDMRSEDLAIGFKAPDDVKVSVDDVEQFKAANKHLSIQVFNGGQSEVLLDELPGFLTKWTAKNGYLASENTIKLTLEDFWGYYIKGRNDKGSALLAVLLEKESQDEVWTILVEYEGPYYETALSILKSLYRL